jgi:2-iminobutanoate/2-iminopropanoate deaminase
MPTLDHITVGAGSTLGTGDSVMSDAVRFGDLLLLSGRAPIDPATMQVVGDGLAEQARVVLRDVRTVLAAAGTDWRQVLRVECFLADPADFQEWNRIWCEQFQPPRPTRTTVVTGFTVPGMLIELQVTAGLEPRR